MPLLSIIYYFNANITTLLSIVVILLLSSKHCFMAWVFIQVLLLLLIPKCYIITVIIITPQFLSPSFKKFCNHPFPATIDARQSMCFDIDNLSKVSAIVLALFGCERCPVWLKSDSQSTSVVIWGAICCSLACERRGIK